MNAVKWIIVVVAGLFGLFVGVTFFLPTDYHVERSIAINAAPEQVYSQVVDLEAWMEWNPWSDMDPDMVITYGDVRVGAGAWYEWQGDASGRGRMTITAAEAPKYAEYELSFEGYEQQPAFAAIHLDAADADGPTTVRWTFDGDVGDQLFARWMAVAMDKFVGASYEKGLQSLKERCETVE